VAWNKDGKVGAEFALIDFGPCSAMNCTAPAGRWIFS